MSFKMDNITSHPTILEDSGVASTSSSLMTPAFESTPNPPQPPSRKRKLPLACGRPSTSPFFPMSSTLNESTISNCFERWNISSFTPNFYVEQPDCPSPDKKQRSEPATPVKEPEETPFYRSHTDSFHKTPTKHAPSQQRLGSPECNEILYGGEIRSNNVLGLKIEKGKQRHSPAKKRLFKSAEFETRRRNLSRQHAKVDPVRFLVKDRHLNEVLSSILGYLSDSDLHACAKVNGEWREAVWADEPSARRLRLSIANFRRDKENCFAGRKSGCGTEVINSPAKQTVCLYYKIGNMLQEGQRLDKCPACTYAAIVDKSIGQCQNDSCGYIYCLSCGSCSTTGPENFTDGCKQSGLLVARPPRHPLLPGSPDRDRPEPPRDSLSFLLDGSSSKLDSSGYVSDLENSSAFHKSRSYSSPLSNYNRDLPGVRPPSARRNSFVPVVTLNMPKRQEIMEPSSPPKIPNVACSAKSKKNLRRLIRN